MPSSRLVLRLLHCLESSGVPEELVGDLVEEMSNGRSPAWVWRQLAALCAHTAIGRLRRRAFTPQGITVLLGGAALVAVSVVPPGRLIQAWLVVYYVSGMASLFAHMASTELPPLSGEPDND